MAVCSPSQRVYWFNSFFFFFQLQCETAFVPLLRDDTVQWCKKETRSIDYRRSLTKIRRKKVVPRGAFNRFQWTNQYLSKPACAVRGTLLLLCQSKRVVNSIDAILRRCTVSCLQFVNSASAHHWPRVQYARKFQRRWGQIVGRARPRTAQLPSLVHVYVYNISSIDCIHY